MKITSTFILKSVLSILVDIVKPGYSQEPLDELRIPIRLNEDNYEIKDCFRNPMKFNVIFEIIFENKKNPGLRPLHHLGERKEVTSTFLDKQSSIQEIITKLAVYYVDTMIKYYDEKEVLPPNKLGLYCKGGLTKNKIFEEIEKAELIDIVRALYIYIRISYEFLLNCRNNLVYIIKEMNIDPIKSKNLFKSNYKIYQYQINHYLCIRKLYQILNRVKNSEIDVLFKAGKIPYKILALNNYLCLVIKMIKQINAFIIKTFQS